MDLSCITQRAGRIAGALIAAAGLALSASCGVLLSIDSSDCTIGDVGASGTDTFHRYAYSLDCSAAVGGLVGDVRASYDVDTQLAQERLDGPKGRITAEWTCPRDPWIRGAGDSFRCTRISRQANLRVDDRQLQELLTSRPPAYPYSAYVLSDSYRHVLDSQLKNALKAKPAPAPAPVPTAAPAPKPTKPDLVLTRLTGPAEIFDGTTAIYEAAIWNEGTTANGTVQLVLNFLGTMKPWQMVETPAGFSCTGSLGGVDSPIQERGAIFKVQGHGAAKGTGTVVVSLNHDRALDESDVANNLKTLNVTVK